MCIMEQEQNDETSTPCEIVNLKELSVKKLSGLSKTEEKVILKPNQI